MVRGMDTDETIGFGPEDLPAATRRVFDLAITQAVEVADPAHDWPAFVEALWREMSELFGWDPGDWTPFAPVPPPPFDPSG
jgi:hypothetical protein